MGSISTMTAKTTVHPSIEGALQGLGPDQYQMFFSLIPDLACICSADGRFTQLNLAWEETLGYPTEELMGRHFLDFVHPDDKVRTVSELGKQDFGYATVHFKNRYVCRDGSYRWFEWNSATTEGAEILALARDITSRVQAEEALRLKERQCQELDQVNEELRKSQELLQAVVNGTTDAIFAKDLDGRYLLCNLKCVGAKGEAIGADAGTDRSCPFYTRGGQNPEG